MNKPTSLTILLAIAAIVAGCNGDTPSDTKKDSTAADSPTVTKPAAPDTSGLPRFNGSAAFDQVAAQVAFGPRNPGSEGHRKTLEYLVAELSKYTPNVTRQNWTQPGYEGATLNLTNVIASFNPSATRRILLCAHWDTRPRGEQDKDSAKRMLPILGANDAGSGVGVLLEMARVMKETPPPVGVDIVLLDGEDYGTEHDLDNYFLGSRYFAKNLPPGFSPSFGILLDMVGDPNAVFAMEAYSLEKAPSVVRALWDAARLLGLKHFVQRPGPGIQDDHLPLNEAGIQTVDIIDADMVGNRTGDPNREYWHTHDDTLDKISAETLETVGRLLVYTIYKLVPAAA
jgi:Zn-dependent M28 family amino/carboxypeptidase